ncbi:hypothetical protein [Pseudomonas indica]|uniref:Lipoprotein n=1 Tax=Pseudomonas indica TaxID=137658 RepID=A0A1G9G4C8_9PSED|nr:hypothetical protein [Pseudomonas indica]SDK95432.1 hypothetical protein SAMN05216186_11296 [Pseudomonas indica]
MRLLPALFLPTLLTACASPLPRHDPQQAWIDLYTTADNLLMAQRLDDKRWGDGRYFQVSPGAHELEVTLRFEVAGGGALSNVSEPMQMTCELQIRYDNFVAGKRYRLEARPMIMKAQAWLYDDQRNVLARGKVLRCGTF